MIKSPKLSSRDNHLNNKIIFNNKITKTICPSITNKIQMKQNLTKRET